MSMPVGTGVPNAAMLSALADQKTDEANREDQELLRARKANRTSNSVDAARTKIENRKKAADENLQAAKDKANGSIIGGVIGIFLLVVAIAAAVALGPVGIGLAAGALAIGGGLLAAAPAIGGAIGGAAAADNEEAAAVATKDADSAELMEKLFEKQGEDDGELIRQNAQTIQQLWQDARKRQADNSFKLKN